MAESIELLSRKLIPAVLIGGVSVWDSPVTNKFVSSMKLRVEFYLRAQVVCVVGAADKSVI